MPRVVSDFSAADDAGLTLVERAFGLIHRDLLSGELRPSAKLRIQELTRRYGIGATPIREALARLSPLGFVQQLGNRGFRAWPLSREDLEDITLTRQITEIGALQRSMERGDGDWEASIVGALHRLKMFTKGGSSGPQEGDADFDRAHKAFHMALIAACGSQRLLELSSGLYDQAYRYRQIMMRSLRDVEDFYEEHARLAEGVIARNADLACAHLHRHLGSTPKVVYPAER